PNAPVVKPEHLGTLRTLGHIVDFLTSGDDATSPADVNGQPGTAANAVQAILLEVVSEKTGYPAEMLEPSMLLDADLGIDSIKRVEILPAPQPRLPDAPVVKPEHLGTLRTLGHIVDFLASTQGAPAPVMTNGRASAERPETAAGAVQAVLLEVVSEKTG